MCLVVYARTLCDMCPTGKLVVAAGKLPRHIRTLKGEGLLGCQCSTCTESVDITRLWAGGRVGGGLCSTTHQRYSRSYWLLAAIRCIGFRDRSRSCSVHSVYMSSRCRPYTKPTEFIGCLARAARQSKSKKEEMRIRKSATPRRLPGGMRLVPAVASTG
jgi:hypothetical protein